VRCRAFEVKRSLLSPDSAKPEDAVDVRRLEFLAELPQVATDDRREFECLTSQIPELVPMTAEPLSGLRRPEILRDGREAAPDLADPRSAHAEARSDLSIAVSGVQKLRNPAGLVNEAQGWNVFLPLRSGRSRTTRTPRAIAVSTFGSMAMQILVGLHDGSP
jgi:hypothetical protein